MNLTDLKNRTNYIPNAWFVYIHKETKQPMLKTSAQINGTDGELDYLLGMTKNCDLKQITKEQYDNLHL